MSKIFWMSLISLRCNDHQRMVFEWVVPASAGCQLLLLLRLPIRVITYEVMFSQPYALIFVILEDMTQQHMT